MPSPATEALPRGIGLAGGLIFKDRAHQNPSAREMIQTKTSTLITEGTDVIIIALRADFAGGPIDGANFSATRTARPRISPPASTAKVKNAAVTASHQRPA